MIDFSRSKSLRLFQEELKKGQTVLVEELWDTPKALLAVLAVQATGKSVLLLTGGMREDKLFDNLTQFAPDLPVEFPAWETLPGEAMQPSPDIIGKRMEALHALMNRKGPSIVLCPIVSLLQKIPSKEKLLFARWKKGDKVAFEKIPELLTQFGLVRAPIVSDKGEFAIRGGIVDLFPVGSSDPYRVEFFDDEIEQIRTFDPVGQKSIAKVSSLFLSPAAEANASASILDYLPNALIMWDDLLAIEDAHAVLKNQLRPPFFFQIEELLKPSMQHLLCSPHPVEKMFEHKNFEYLSQKFEPYRFFHKFLKIDEEDYLQPDATVYFYNANETEEVEVKRMLEIVKLPKDTHFERGYFTSGFTVRDIPLSVIPNPELTHRSRIRRQKWRSTYHTPASEFHQLKEGDPVVHFHNGIGRFAGIRKQDHHGEPTEFLEIEYADGAKLFVPLSQAYLVSRYIGSSEEMPTLSTLGSKRWQTIRLNASKQIVGYANDLLKMHAERAAHGGFQCEPDSEFMKQFEDDFPYQETQDQVLAIDALKHDMMSQKAMDRVICGDVGYGKTEVAMRAAFKAVADGHKQVAVLVPTTVLAMQHYDTFSQRMHGFPVRVGVVSRFQTVKEAKKVLKDVEEGNIDILVGTHRLLSKDVVFKDLGLLIIDEEQRFGVRAKEHLKRMKVGVDCLTLSATPIPRTLYMSLVGARDMSVISTPPQDRLPVKTIIAEPDDELIAGALTRELARGGQSFFIHNRVETIFGKAAAIQKLVPALRIGVVHGQMDTDAVDNIFHKFKTGELDILFATTIVENGIDVPNANTILIDRADTHGLSDLYQLRGRVGRWNRSAFAYFLVPRRAALPEITRKRLNALVEASGYGGGMKIAMRDLEIRGAGDILGEQQSGQVSAIGFHLYCKLLKKAIEALKKKKSITFEETKMEFPFDARLPDNYINEVSLRMELYHRMGETTTTQEVDELLAEMQDRFGTPPLPVLWLYHLTRIKAIAMAGHYTRIKYQNNMLLIEKGPEKKTIPLFKKITTPKELEELVTREIT